jgi:hypothetical protein
MMEGLNEAALGEDEALEEESNSDEEDAQLARLLESASDIVGKKKQKRKREAESDEDEAYFYDDFFGSGPQSGIPPPSKFRPVADTTWEGYLDAFVSLKINVFQV